jgi:hypothetical protein
MRHHLLNLLERVPAGCPDEEFFLAGPSSGAAKPSRLAKGYALLADIRRQPRRGRRTLAA